MKETKKLPYLLLFLGTFLCFALEGFVLSLEVVIFNDINVGQWPLLFTLIHWGITIWIWFVSAFFLHYIAKKKADLNLFEPKEDIPKRNWIFLLFNCFVILTLSIMIMGGQLKPFVQMVLLQERFGNYSILASLFQYMYFLAQGLLICFAIGFGQEFGEKCTNIRTIPWGGILCGLAWGLLRIFSMGFMQGLILFFFSILYGNVFILLNKNLKFALPIITILLLF